MAANARDTFASCFTTLLKDSGLQAKQAAARANVSRPQGVSWRVTAGLLSAWKTGRNLPSEANQDGFFRVVRVLTEHARGRAARGHQVGQLFDEVAWARLLKQAWAAPLPDASHRAEIELYLRTLIEWLNEDPWPLWFDRRALTPGTIERKLRIVGNHDGGHESEADELASRCTRLVVLGGPGSGKTWLARRTARLCAQTALDRLALGDSLDEVELPLYTTCARLAAAPLVDGIRRAIISSALSQLPDLGGSRILDAIQTVFDDRNAPTLLIADSLDEARGADDRIRLAGSLPPSWRIVLTTRPASWNRQLAVEDKNPSQVVGVLQPLQYPGDVEPFIATWFSGQPERASSITAQLRNRSNLHRAATVPMMLAFYCIVGGDQPLPDSRADLYRKVIRRMLTGLWRGSGDQDSDPDECLETLWDWAWMAAAKDSTSGLGIWSDEFSTPRVRRVEDRDSLAHIAVPLSLPDPDTGGVLRRFVHRSIHEHLVAEYVAFRMTPEEAATELLNHLWFDLDWEQAGPAALAMHPQRSQVLKFLIREVTKNAPLAAVDGCWEVRRFLARIAQESAEDDWSLEAAELIGQARQDLVISRPYNILQTMASDWPTSNRLILQLVLRLLTGDTTAPTATEWIMEANAEPWQPGSDHLFPLWEPFSPLTQAVIKLATTDEDRAKVGQALLSLLVSRVVSPHEVWLRQAVAMFATTSASQAKAREKLLSLLVDETNTYRAVELADTVSRLDGTDEDRAKARKKLLDLLSAEIAPEAAWKLAYALIDLVPTGEDRARARDALLRALPAANCHGADAIAHILTQLEPTAEDRTKARELLFGMLKLHPGLVSDPMWTALLADAISLAVEDDDWQHSQEKLLGLLAEESYPDRALQLAEEVIRLAVTDQDRAKAREGPDLRKPVRWLGGDLGFSYARCAA